MSSSTGKLWSRLWDVAARGDDALALIREAAP
jgi:hypothetical protein